MSEHGPIIVLLGPPGAGKGSQAQELARKRGFLHISTGDALREEIARETPIGLKIREAVEAGGFADDATVLALVLDRIGRPEARRGVILDGFPRNLNQARELDRVLEERGTAIWRAVLIDTPEDAVIERLSGRRVCPRCGAPYHMTYRPPRDDERCDSCGTPLERRADDAPEAIRRRLEAYHKRTEPVIDYYRKRSKLRKVAGDGSLEEVAARLEEVLELPPSQGDPLLEASS